MTREKIHVLGFNLRAIFMPKGVEHQICAWRKFANITFIPAVRKAGVLPPLQMCKSLQEALMGGETVRLPEYVLAKRGPTLGLPYLLHAEPAGTDQGCQRV